MDSSSIRRVSALAGILLLSAAWHARADEPPRVLTVPETIAADFSRDVTAELNALLAKLPDGASVAFPPGARYRVDGTLLLKDKQSIVVEGNGAVFRAFQRGADHAKQENYSGWRETRNRAHWRIEGGRNITIRNLEVHGAHPHAGKSGTYDANREAQHGFDLSGVEQCLLESLNIHDCYGDCIYLSRVRGVVIRGSQLTRCGRQGIAVATGTDVLIENNDIADSRRGIIDIEPYGKDWETGNIWIIGNRLGRSRLLLLPMGGSGRIGSVFIADNTNTQANGTPAIANHGQPDQRRGPFLMVNNRLTIGGSPAAGLKIVHNDGVFLAGNELIFPEQRKMTALELSGSRGAVVGNRFLGAAAVTSAGEMNPNITLSGNETRTETSELTTEWKRVLGGFAVRTTVPEETFVALMRGGSSAEPAPEQIRGYGQSTTARFAWFHLRGEQLVRSESRE